MSVFKPNKILNGEILKQLDRENLIGLIEEDRDRIEAAYLAFPSPDPNDDYNFNRLAWFYLDPSNGIPAKLADAFSFIDPLTQGAAVDEIQDELLDAKIFPPETAKFSDADWAVFAYRKQPSIVLRLFPRYASRGSPACQRFRASTAKLPPINLDAVPKLTEKLTEFFKAKKLGDKCTVEIFAEKDGSRTAIVKHGEAFCRIGMIEDDQPAALGHPERFDIIHIGANPAELAVFAKRRSIQEAYRVLFGEHLFGDDELFVGTATYTLAPLGEDALAVCNDKLIPGLTSVAITELHYKFGGFNEEETILRGKNVLYRYDADGRATPRILPRRAPCRVKFSLQIEGIEDPLILEIKPPYTARPSRLCDSDVPEKWLVNAGIDIGIPEDAPAEKPELVGAT